MSDLGLAATILGTITVLALVPSVIAHKKGHSFFAFWVYGVLLWPIAVVAALLLRPLTRCRFCLEQIKAEALACRHCGHLQSGDDSMGMAATAGAPSPSYDSAAKGTKPAESRRRKAFAWANGIMAGVQRRQAAMVSLVALMFGLSVLAAFPLLSGSSEIQASHAEPMQLMKMDPGKPQQPQNLEGAGFIRAAVTPPSSLGPVEAMDLEPDEDTVANDTDGAMQTSAAVSDVDADEPLMANNVARVQTALNALGFKAGRVDGVWGSRTKQAIRRFQLENELPPTGLLTSRLLREAEYRAAKEGKAPTSY